MQLDDIIIRTRLRSGWSAIDLGFTVARQFWLRSVALYLVPALIVFGLARLVAPYSVWLPYIILWWCKPLFERPILSLISRELFSEKMSFSKVIREYKSWLYPSILAVLGVRRLSFYRGVTAPIGLLEGPKGKDYRTRANVLSSKVSNNAFWLNIVLFHLESFLVFGVLILIELWAPDAIEFTSVFTQGDQQPVWYSELLTLFVMAMVAPFYVIAGFMLYISRRIELEGWDIEIAFRDWMRQTADTTSQQDVAKDTALGLSKR